MDESKAQVDNKVVSATEGVSSEDVKVKSVVETNKSETQSVETTDKVMSETAECVSQSNSGEEEKIASDSKDENGLSNKADNTKSSDTVADVTVEAGSGKQVKGEPSSDTVLPSGHERSTPQDHPAEVTGGMSKMSVESTLESSGTEKCTNANNAAVGSDHQEKTTVRKDVKSKTLDSTSSATHSSESSTASNDTKEDSKVEDQNLAERTKCVKDLNVNSEQKTAAILSVTETAKDEKLVQEPVEQNSPGNQNETQHLATCKAESQAENENKMEKPEAKPVESVKPVDSDGKSCHGTEEKSGEKDTEPNTIKKTDKTPESEVISKIPEFSVDGNAVSSIAQGGDTDISNTEEKPHQTIAVVEQVAKPSDDKREETKMKNEHQDPGSGGDNESKNSNNNAKNANKENGTEGDEDGSNKEKELVRSKEEGTKSKTSDADTTKSEQKTVDEEKSVTTADTKSLQKADTVDECKSDTKTSDTDVKSAQRAELKSNTQMSDTDIKLVQKPEPKSGTKTLDDDTKSVQKPELKSEVQMSDGDTKSVQKTELKSDAQMSDADTKSVQKTQLQSGTKTLDADTKSVQKTELKSDAQMSDADTKSVQKTQLQSGTKTLDADTKSVQKTELKSDAQTSDADSKSVQKTELKSGTKTLDADSKLVQKAELKSDPQTSDAKTKSVQNSELKSDAQTSDADTKSVQKTELQSGTKTLDADTKSVEKPELKSDTKTSDAGINTVQKPELNSEAQTSDADNKSVQKPELKSGTNVSDADTKSVKETKDISGAKTLDDATTKSVEKTDMVDKEKLETKAFDADTKSLHKTDTVVEQKSETRPSDTETKSAQKTDVIDGQKLETKISSADTKSSKKPHIADERQSDQKNDAADKLKSDAKVSDTNTKSVQKSDIVAEKKSETKEIDKTQSSSKGLTTENKENVAVDNAKRDVKDTRPSKSYSAQRNANRSNRRGNVDEPRGGRTEGTKGNETNVRDDRRNRDEERRVKDSDRDKDRNRDRDQDQDRDRDKDRDRDRGKDKNRDRDRDRDRNQDRDKDRERGKDREREKGRDAREKDQQRDKGRPKEADRTPDKNKSRDDRRDRRSTPPSQETRRAKTREEREQEEAERRKKDEERRKKREEERKRLEEERKKREEERKRKEEERKQKEEEERKREEERKAEEEKKRQEEEKKRQEEEAVRLKEEEEKQANEISVEAAERMEARMEMRKKNLSAADNRPDESFFTKLDSSMKKNTAFVKKLKIMTESQRLSLTKEFNTLNLTKYVGEVATSIAEAKLKMSDISCAVHMCTLVHHRYADFSSHLLQAIQKILPAPPSKKDKDKDKDDQKPAIVFDSKIRTELRFLAELIVAGIFTEKEGLPILNGVLSVILNSDKESHSNLPIIISFTKHCGEDFAGFVPRKNRIIAEKFGLTLPTSEVFSTQMKNAYKNLLKDHYASVTKYLLKKHKELQKLERQNMRMLQTKGELSDERKKVHEETQALHQKLLMNTSSLADLIDEDVPDLPIDEKLQEENELMAMDFFRAENSSAEFDFETSLWEDEDTRTFHENLIDLRTMVPAILFKDNEKRAAPGDKSEEDLDKFDEDIQAMEVSESAQEAEEEDDDDDDAEEVGGNRTEEDDMVGESEEPETEEADEDEEEEESTTSNVSMKVMLDAFLQKLPECVNRDFIDKAAVEFCMNLNTKANRRKLVKALFNVPRTRLDLLSFYSRLVATLYPCMPDIATDLVDRLKQDFRWHMRKKDQMKIESKIKIVRFLGELTKFKMCPKADTLQCLKQLLLVFHHHHIDMACNLLDVCGRYLYRSKDSHLRTKALLDLMMRKRNKMHMNERHSTMVENAFFYCNPPESKQMEQKVRPPLHEYIRKLLFKDLTKITVERVLKQMRKLPWDDMEIRQYAVKCLSSVWNVKFNNVHCMANLLAGLVLYHDYIGIQVVDAVLEDIRIGMEINHPKFNQRRVTVVKYLGELYNYRMVESSVIFKTMYSFIRFGITLEVNTPSLLDPPEHLFRIRLSCTLLDTCGQFFDRGTSKKKLDCFLVYFQQYILFKRSLEVWNKETRPFPLDVDNAIADTLESLRPKLKLFTTLEEANTGVEELEKEYVDKLGDVINLTRVNPNQQPGGPLSTITEGDETNVAIPAGGRRLSFTTGTEDEEESDSDMDSEDVRRPGRGSNPNSQSQSQGLSQNTEEAGYDTEENMLLDSAGENEEDDRVTVLTGGPRLVKCEEDDEFTSAFDKMMCENIQQRTVEAAKVPQLDISVPVAARNKPKKTYDIFHQEDIDQPVTMNFTLMTRSGKKQQYRDFEVPISSELAANLHNRERAEMAEKRRMKELTLNINERQEEEDYQEMIASLQKPAMATPGVAPVVHVVPREQRKPRFHHPKGAPDVDQIFHQTGNRKW